MMIERMKELIEDLNIIQEHIFVTKPGAVECYSLCENGADGKGNRTERLINTWKNAWERKNKTKDIYYVELDMASYAINDDVNVNNWVIWFDLIRKLSQLIPIDSIDCDDFRIMIISEIYQYFTTKMQPEDVTEQVKATAQNNMKELFSCYESLNIHVILVMKNFEACRNLFPKDKETNFYRILFVLSPKGSVRTLKLTILLCALSPISELAHHYDGISPVPSAYTSGAKGGGNLAQYSEEDFEAYLKSLTE